MGALKNHIEPSKAKGFNRVTKDGRARSLFEKDEFESVVVLFRGLTPVLVPENSRTAESKPRPPRRVASSPSGLAITTTESRRNVALVFCALRKSLERWQKHQHDGLGISGSS